MEIKFSKRRIKNNLFSGLIFLGIGLTIFIWKDTGALRYLWILFGALQLFSAWYNKNNPYISIRENILTKHSLFPTSIHIDEITKVWKLVNSYKIETSDKTLTIEKDVIEPEYLNLLADYLNGLEIKRFKVEK